MCSISMAGQLSVVQSEIAAGGGTHTNGDKQMVAATAEVAVGENSQGNLHLSEGFIHSGILVLIGVQDFGQLDHVLLYPNPVTDNLTIEFPVAGTYEVFLFDMDGRLLSVRQYNDTDLCVWDLSGFPPAVYWVAVTDRERRKAAQFKIMKE